MIKIAVCDDEEIFIDNVVEFLEVYKREFNSEVIIKSYNCGIQLLDEIEIFDLLLLDVEMPEMNGFEVAKEIRRRGVDCEIVFLTSAKEMGYKGFEVQAKDYLIKPIKYNVLTKVINSEIDAINKKKNETIVFTISAMKLKSVNFSELLYIESSGKKCLVKCETEEFTVIDKLKDIRVKLCDYPMSNPHRSYLINNWKIKDYNSKEVLLKDDSNIPLSRLKHKDFREHYFKFLSGVRG